MSSLNVKGCQKYKSWGENQHIFIRKEHYSEFAETEFLKKEPGIAFAFHAMFELLSERMYVSHCLVLFCINLHPPQVDTAGLSLSNTTTKSILHNMISNYSQHSESGWQNLAAFRQTQKWPQNFCKARICYFCDKFVFFARDCKLANLNHHNTQRIPCNSTLIAQETLFLPKVIQKVHNLRQIFKISWQYGVCSTSRQKVLCGFTQLLPPCSELSMSNGIFGMFDGDNIFII